MHIKKSVAKIALALTSLLFSSAIAFPLYPCVNWPHSDFQPTPNTQTHTLAPDYGLYWFKMGEGKYPEIVKKAYTPNTLEPYFSDGTQNTNPGPNQADYTSAKRHYEEELEKLNYFDPAKPTVIFIHGWDPNSTINSKRFDFCYQYRTSQGSNGYSEQYNTLEYFKQQGWNVAVFYWNQFSDELYIPTAEEKIYPNLTASPREWTYIDQNNTLQHCANSLDKHCMAIPKNALGNSDSITELALLAYKNAFPENYHQDVRIVGFSLGSQIAIQLTNDVVQNTSLPQPSRLTLLDPYFSTATPTGLAHNVPEFNYLALKSLLSYLTSQHRAIAISMYRTSPLSYHAYNKLILGNHDVSQHIAYTKLFPKYLNAFLEDDILESEHTAAPPLYFQSMRATPTIKCKHKNACAKNAYVDAAATNNEIQNMAGLRRYQKPDAILPWKDTSEHNFPDTQDDVFSDVR